MTHLMIDFSIGSKSFVTLIVIFFFLFFSPYLRASFSRKIGRIHYWYSQILVSEILTLFEI